MTTTTTKFHRSAAAVRQGFYKLRTLLWFGILASRETCRPNNDDDNSDHHTHNTTTTTTISSTFTVLQQQFLTLRGARYLEKSCSRPLRSGRSTSTLHKETARVATSSTGGLKRQAMPCVAIAKGAIATSTTGLKDSPRLLPRRSRIWDRAMPLTTTSVPWLSYRRRVSSAGAQSTRFKFTLKHA